MVAVRSVILVSNTALGDNPSILVRPRLRAIGPISQHGHYYGAQLLKRDLVAARINNAR